MIEKHYTFGFSSVKKIMILPKQKMQLQINLQDFRERINDHYVCSSVTVMAVVKGSTPSTPQTFPERTTFESIWNPLHT